MSAWQTWSAAWDVGKAPTVASLVDNLTGAFPDIHGHLVFWSSADIDPEALTALLRERLGRVRPWGMSAIGPAAPGAIARHGFSAILLPAADVDLRGVDFPPDPSDAAWEALPEDLAHAERELGLHTLLEPGREGFLLLMLAGGWSDEEYVAARLHLTLPDLPLVGGTAGDGFDHRDTWSVAAGRVLRGRHLAIIGRSRVPFRVFQHHHFAPTSDRLVVTALGDGPRVVRRINGRPAREVIARILGVDLGAIDPAYLSRHPLGVRIGDQWFVRSIHRVEGDDLHFASAVGIGTVLTVLKSGDMTLQLRSALATLRREGALGVLMFSCVARLFEIERDGHRQLIEDALAGLPVAGGHTYGEQYMGLHLNQTCTAIAFLETSA